MKNIIKLAFIIFTSISFVSANAGTLSVSGSAKFTYDILSSDSSAAKNDLGKGLGVTNELNFTAAGELDNGWKWNYSMELDPSATPNNAGGAALNDDTQLTLTTPYGTVGAFISEGGLNAQMGYSAAAYKAGTDFGIGGHIDPMDISSFNNLQYHSPAGLIPFGTVFKVAYTPSADTQGSASDNAQGATTTKAANTADTSITNTANVTSVTAVTAVKDATEYYLQTTPIEGLTVKASYIDIDSSVSKSTDHTQYEAGAANAKYAYGPVTVGYGRTYVVPFTPATAAGSFVIDYVKTTDMSIGYAVNENLTVSYEKSNSDAFTKTTNASNTVTRVTESQDSQTIQAAYTMGGMTLALSQSMVDGDGYTKADGANRVDAKETIFAVTMAF